MQSLLNTLGNYKNVSVQSIFRILWAAKGQLIEWEKGCLEIHFENQQVLFLTVAPDGSSVTVNSEKWKDPLYGLFDAQTQRWIEETGRYIKVDISSIYPFSEIC